MGAGYPRAKRDPLIDVLRGVCFVFMTVDHLPGSPFARFSNPNYGPFGFFTAALGFVLISGFVSGFVYEESRVRDGFGAMTRRVFARVRALYVTQLVLYATLAVAVVARLPGVSAWNLDLYSDEPWKGLFLSASMLYEPAYLGILPMYCMFLLATPFLIWQFDRGWLPYVLATSALVWIAAGLLVRLPADPNGVDFGAFNPLSYQVVFVVGLAFGTKRLSFMQVPPRIWQWMVVGAAGVTTLFFALRLEYALERPVKTMIDRFSMAFSVVQLGPLRLLDFAAFAFLPRLIVPRFLRPGRTTAAGRWLGFIGGHSLPVFAWSILTTYAAVALLPSSPNTLIGLAAALVAVASLTIPATARAALLRRRAAGQALAVASRSPKDSARHRLDRTRCRHSLAAVAPDEVTGSAAESARTWLPLRVKKQPLSGHAKSRWEASEFEPPGPPSDQAVTTPSPGQDGHAPHPLGH